MGVQFPKVRLILEYSNQGKKKNSLNGKKKDEMGCKGRLRLWKYDPWRACEPYIRRPRLTCTDTRREKGIHLQLKRWVISNPMVKKDHLEFPPYFVTVISVLSDSIQYNLCNSYQFCLDYLSFFNFSQHQKQFKAILFHCVSYHKITLLTKRENIKE